MNWLNLLKLDLKRPKDQYFYYLINLILLWNTNVIIAAFVTVQARLKLYNEFDKLGERVLYFDTDSVFFVKIEEDYVPELGNYLGQFTNEIQHSEGAHII